MRTSNPVLNDHAFDAQALDPAQAMTIQGTVNKTILLLVLVAMSAYGIWNNPAGLSAWFWPALIGGFIMAMVTVFKKEWAPVTAPIYALLEGVILGGISVFTERAYPGIVGQAVGLTFGTLFALLLVYKSGLIRVTDNFRMGLFAATGGIALFYFVSFILSFFGVRIPMIYSSGIFGIGFSVVVVIIAALNLVLDFDFIEQGSRAGAPKYMEWYGAFGLLVTLVWLYLEILRLLTKLRER
jgi:uncharacterized YccA/Bax inhibitor family protein